MSGYRKHWLINSNGERYDFTEDNSKILLSSPQGFGFKKEYESIKINNSEILTSSNLVLGDITGELLFYKNANAGDIYQDYFNFLQFAKFKPLEFHYQTPNNIDSYYCEVLFTEARKTEVSKESVLRVNVVFHRLTEWLDDTSKKIVLTNTPIGTGKHYELIRDYHYSGTNMSNSPIINTGTNDVGFIVDIEGSVQNPQFALTQNGVQYGICRINGTYDYVMINSVEQTESIYLERNGSAISNPEQYQDFTIRDNLEYLTWCKLKVGETIFNFTCGNTDTFDGTVTIRFKNSYASV